MRKTIMMAALSALILMGSCKPGKPQGTQPATPASTQPAPSQQAAPMALTAEEFRERVADYEAHPEEWVFKGDKPAIIDFYADWCRPCKMMAPTFKSMAREYAGKVDFYKIDIDQQPELAQLFGVQSIPSLLFIPLEGKPTMSVGLMEQEQLRAAIQTHLMTGKQN